MEKNNTYTYSSYCKDCEHILRCSPKDKEHLPFSPTEHDIIIFMSENDKSLFSMQKALWRNRRSIEKEINYLVEYWFVKPKKKNTQTKIIETNVIAIPKQIEKPYWWEDGEISLPKSERYLLLKN